MKAEDLKAKTEDELKKILLDTRKAQFNMRFQRSGGQLEKTHDIRTARRTVARIKTFLNQKQAGNAPVPTKAKPEAKAKAKAKPASAKKTKAA